MPSNLLDQFSGHDACLGPLTQPQIARLTYHAKEELL